jgi:hypothetical protein
MSNALFFWFVLASMVYLQRRVPCRPLLIYFGIGISIVVKGNYGVEENQLDNCHGLEKKKEAI